MVTPINIEEETRLYDLSSKLNMQTPINDVYVGYHNRAHHVWNDLRLLMEADLGPLDLSANDIFNFVHLVFGLVHQYEMDKTALRRRTGRGITEDMPELTYFNSIYLSVLINLKRHAGIRTDRQLSQFLA